MDEIAGRLAQHVSRRSIFPGEEAYAIFLERRLTELGFDVDRQQVEAGRFNIVAERGQGDVAVGLYGHIDTVPAYGEWDHPPFEGCREDDRLYGLGACDMKAGNLAVLETVRELPDDIHVLVAFGVDEENMSKGSTVLMESGFFDDASIVLVPEPAGRQSMQEVGCGRRGRIAIEVTVHGRSAHAATPSAGTNAIREASELVRELDKVELGSDTAMGDADLTIRSFEADSGSLSIPDEARIVLDRHMVPGETITDCLDQVRHAAERATVDADVELRDRPTPYLAPYRTGLDRDVVQRFVETVEDQYGDHVEQYGMSVADENRLAEGGMPVITYGPIGGNEHRADEWVDLASIRDLVRTYRRFIARLVEGG